MVEFEGIEFGPIPEERYNDVINHLRNNFFADEPLNHAVSLCRPGEPHAELEEHSLTTLRDGLSQMAVHTDTGQVIGVALNGIQHPGDIAAAQAKLETMADVKFRRIFDLLYGVNRSLDLFKQHGVDRIFECRILSVDKRFRGRGLARELLQRSVVTARESGFKAHLVGFGCGFRLKWWESSLHRHAQDAYESGPIFYTTGNAFFRVFKEDATGLFSQRVAESLGLQTVRQIRYSEYMAEDTGEVVFKMPAPHDTLKIMVKILQ